MNLMNSNVRDGQLGRDRKVTSARTLNLVANRHNRGALVRIVAICVLLTTLVSASHSYAQAWTQVQGRLIGIGYYGPVPAGGVVLTLFNWQLGRSRQSISRPDGTFYFRNIPLGWYNVEVWIPNNPYPRTVRVAVNQVPVVNVGVIQLDMRTRLQGPPNVGVVPGQPGWVQAGY